LPAKTAKARETVKQSNLFSRIFAFFAGKNFSSKAMKHFFFTIHKTPKRAEVSDEFALSTLQKHTAYFKDLGRAGKCLVAGPFADQATELGGGFYVLAAENEAAAEALAAADPLVVEGLYDFKMREWIKVVPE
jgi:uncharacterized protein